MAFKDKLMFWKKSDKDDMGDMDFGDMGKDDPFSSGQSNDPFGGQQQSADPLTGQQQPTDPFAGQDPSASNQATDSFAQQPTAPMPQQGFGAPQQQNTPVSDQPYELHQKTASSSSDTTYMTNKNLEVLSSKLDALKAAIESMSQRLENIERMAYGEQEHQKTRYKQW